MFDIGWSELLVIAIVAIVVVGPKDLPKLMRTFGFYAGKVRRAAADFQRQFHEAMAESEADEVRKNLESIRAGMGTRADFAAPIDKPLMMPAQQATAEPAAPPPAKPKRASRSKSAAKPKAKAKTAAATAKRRKPKAAAKTGPKP